jgi:hypothetical protein
MRSSRLWYKNPDRISQAIYYVSATEPNRLKLYKIFHGCDYEACRILGYKNPDRTSQKTHYISATYPTQLMLCKFWGFHVGDYEECRLLRCSFCSLYISSKGHNNISNNTVKGFSRISAIPQVLKLKKYKLQYFLPIYYLVCVVASCTRFLHIYYLYLFPPSMLMLRLSVFSIFTFVLYHWVLLTSTLLLQY